MKILVINPGSTSTKIAVYENETPLFVSNIKHSVEELSAFPEVIDQFEFRKNLVLDCTIRAKRIISAPLENASFK